jgi:hypothetical protein
MKTDRYKVLWTTYARVALARMKEFKVDPMNVFRRIELLPTNLHEASLSIFSPPSYSPPSFHIH